MNFLQKIRQQVTEFWQSRNRAQKIRIVVSIAAVIILVSIMLYIINQPKYVPLYTNLDIKDAGEIAKKLDDLNIPYKIADGGKSILVTPEQKYKTMLTLAQEGLPKSSSSGFDELFNTTQLGTTDWERQVRYNQALQGELAKAIEMMESVESAKVYIVQQEKSLFIETDSGYEPSAAVFLQLKPSAQPTKEEILGIINLVTHSVKNMKSENVVVVDQYGRTLSTGVTSKDEGDDSGLLNDRLAIQDNFQNQLQANVQSLLEQVFGPGNVAVRVNAKLNFDKKIVQNKLFSPVSQDTGEGIVRSIQELKEHFTGTGNASGGTPGVDANVPGYAQAQTGQSEQQKSETVKNFEINETNENLTVAPGAVDKLTVSVIINKELTNAERDAITQVVGNAIGYDPQRDQISVESMEFNNDLMKSLTDEMTRQQSAAQRARNIKIAGIILLILAAAIGARTFFARRKAKSEEEEISKAMLEIQQAASAKAQGEGTAEIIEEQENTVYSQIEKLARHKPEDVAKVLKSWLKED
ncbi:flagellar M-ring protein [Tepidanaerobacter syntrophicus]|uniref:Flagellar M-ring protein n=1 Tax=Tepidanaerobacter syntrophicus TaxID=224999 RepID=A0A0U9HK08_9FIRM|nr:flagellar basal-body MS-ring/collar protein FliF [Tepidanaerobacter syntrophicus]GAQ26260.1 flagellar M-ring protein FliF [Tepidanaerobacter syntrophicus]GLI19248.1 flagellar M-ring protein [Tepidanaerobacter syntrophicus]GLI50118.1 flagellar M-ring protein [Tepidanaerobacter syntrophicus]HHV83526.1 flagellar M-ring protein FliF [Tepidanaerobacter syntrophicus]